MDLTTKQERLLAEGLSDSFNRNKLTVFLAQSDGLGKDFEDYAPPGEKDYQIHKIIQGAKMEGWLDSLLLQAVASRPNEVKFAVLATELGLSVTGPNLSTFQPIANVRPANPQRHFESIIRGGRTDFDIASFLAKLSVLQSQICRIETSNPNGNGTGFLVAPDLVLTNYHVMKPVIENRVAATDVNCRFDYRKTADGSKELPGKPYKLDGAGWNVDHSPYSEADKSNNNGDPTDQELDYCLVRLTEEAGEDKAGGSKDIGADKRGWIHIDPDQNAGAADDDIIILQHPKGDPLKMALGRHLGFNDVQNRTKYDADTQVGASGSPVLNRNLEVIALHHRGDLDADELAMTAEFNQGIPMGKIISRMVEKGTFWG